MKKEWLEKLPARLGNSLRWLICLAHLLLWTNPIYANTISFNPTDGIISNDPDADDFELEIKYNFDQPGTLTLNGGGFDDFEIDYDIEDETESYLLEGSDFTTFDDFFVFTVEFTPEGAFSPSVTETIDLAIDATRPPVPANFKVLPANQALVISWLAGDQTPPPFDDNVLEYRLYWSASDLAGLISVDPLSQTVGIPIEPLNSNVNLVELDFTNNYILDDLENDVTYYFAIEAIDHAGNRSGLTIKQGTTVVATTGTPVETVSYMDLIGAKDKCFIATAAFGAVDNWWVEQYRVFRDQFLLRVPGGTMLVDFYYANGPHWASKLSSAPQIRLIVRGLLILAMPIVYLLGQLGPWLLLCLLIAVTAAVIKYRARQQRWVSTLPLTMLFLFIFATQSFAGDVMGAAQAQGGDLGDDSTLTTQTTPTKTKKERKTRYSFYDLKRQAVSLKFGPFNPKNASAASTQGGGDVNYRDAYGKTGAFRFELEYDWLPLNFGGQWGIGLRGGFIIDNGNSLFADATSFSRTAEKTRMVFFPISGILRYRGKWVDRQPVTIGGEVGVDFWPWMEEQKGRSNNVQNFVSGWHAGGELTILLDWMERRAATNMDDQWGIEDTEIFAGYQYNVLDDFSRKRIADFTYHSWFVGLRFVY